MNVLMFGWEFPPRISGGLGTACAGLTSALGRAGHRISFVLPQGTDAPVAENVRIISASARLGHRSLPQLRVLAPYLEGSFFTDSADDDNGAGAESVVSEPWFGPYGPYDQRRARPRRDFQDKVHVYGQIAGEIAADETADLIHSHDWLSIPAGLEARRQTGRPLVLHIHSVEADRCGSHPDAAIQELEREGMLAADHVIAVSHYARRRIITEYGIPWDKVSVVHNGLSWPPLVPPRERPQLSEAPVILFLGRVTEQKGPECFLRAAPRILAEISGARFIMAGTGNLLARMRDLAKGLGIDSQVAFPGFLADAELAATLSSSDVFVMPSVSEPFGIAALEAAASGVLVIASERCGVREVLPDVFTMPPGDHGCLADLIIRLVRSPELYASSVAWNQDAVRECSWDRAARSVIDIYESLL